MKGSKGKGKGGKKIVKIHLNHVRADSIIVLFAMTMIKCL